VNGCMAYDTLDGQTYIQDINQALDFTHTMENSLLCTKRARAHGVVVEDVPKFLDNNSHHSISFPDDGVVLRLLLHGPVSYLPVRYPTDEELNSCHHLELSCHDSPWDPMAFGKAPDDRRGDTPQRSICSHVNHAWGEPFDLYQSLVASINISSVSHNSQTTLTPEYLADKWGISLESAKRTITSTSHHSIRATTGATSKRSRTRAHQSRYRQLGGYLSTFASDTFSSKVKSLRRNSYVQLFCNRGDFVRSYPIKLKSHAYYSLNRFIHRSAYRTIN